MLILPELLWWEWYIFCAVTFALSSTITTFIPILGLVNKVIRQEKYLAPTIDTAEYVLKSLVWICITIVLFPLILPTVLFYRDFSKNVATRELEERLNRYDN